MPRSRDKSSKATEAARLRRLRSTLGLTQRELAAEFKVAHGAIATWESGKQALPGPVIKLLELYEEELGIGANDGGILRLKTSMLARNAALSRAAAATATQAMGAWLERMIAHDEHRNAITARTNAAIARNIVATLGDLKGIALKVGQTMGFLDYALPEAAREEFRSAQYLSQPMAPAAVAQVFLEEFGEPPRRLFAEWNPQPFAAASIGQVHRARLLSGESVAVKVQYPAVVDAIETDLRSAAVFDQLTGLLFRGQDRGAFIGELRERFTEECDYRVEAANQEEFRRRWAGRPGIRIPRVFHDYTRRRVLVTSLEAGEHLDSFLMHATQESRDAAGATLWQFAFEALLNHGVFHADPHAGNFLFANGEVIVLDFGCVKRFPRERSQEWRMALRAALSRDRASLRDSLLRARSIKDPRRYDVDYDIGMVYCFYEPLLREGAFHFSREFAERSWRVSMVENPNKFRVNTPKDWLFANRTQYGLYAMLARLGCKTDFRRPTLDFLYEPHESRPTPFTDDEVALLGRPRAALTA